MEFVQCSCRIASALLASARNGGAKSETWNTLRRGLELCVTASVVASPRLFYILRKCLIVLGLVYALSFFCFLGFMSAYCMSYFLGLGSVAGCCGGLGRVLSSLWGQRLCLTFVFGCHLLF